MQANLKSLQEERAKEEAFREQMKGQQGGGEGGGFNPERYVGCGKNQDVVIRILGEPFQNRVKPTDHKLVLVSKVVKDDNSGYTTIYWPAEKTADYRYEPDSNFIFTKLLNKVRKAEWVKWTESDFDNRDLRLTRDGNKIINAKGHNGHYVDLYSHTSIYKRVMENDISAGGKASLYPRRFYPTAKVMMNVIDRTDTWCRDNKSAKILCSNKEYVQDKDRTFIDVGVGTQLYDTIIDRVAQGVGDWEKIDIIVQRKYTGKEFKNYEVWTADFPQFFLSPTTKDIASVAELTSDERGYTLFNFDTLYKARYSGTWGIKASLGNLFKLCDAELNTNFVAELDELVREEELSRGGETSNPKTVHSSADVPRETATQPATEDTLRKAFPFYDKLSPQDSVSLKKNLSGINDDIFEGCVPVWTNPRAMAKCFKEGNCHFVGSTTMTHFPSDMTQCPVCGAKSA